MGDPFSLCAVEVEIVKAGCKEQPGSLDVWVQVYATLLVITLYK